MRKLFWISTAILLSAGAIFMTLVKLETWEAVQESEGQFHQGTLVLTFEDGKKDELAFQDPIRLFSVFEALDADREIMVEGKRVDGKALDRLGVSLNTHGDNSRARLTAEWATSVASCSCAQRKELTYRTRAGMGLRTLSDKLGL